MKLGRKCFFCLLVVTLLLAIIPAVSAEGGYVPPMTEDEWEVLKLVNKARFANGLEPVTAFQGIQDACDTRAKELVNRFARLRPNGSLYSSAMEEKQVYSTHAGENIARGQTSPTQVMESWMNNEVDRASILSSQFLHMGVGYYYDATSDCGHYWEQMFCSTLGYETNEYLGLMIPENGIPMGTAIDDMGVYAVFENKPYGICYLPIIAEYCTGYDADSLASQTVTVTVMGVTDSFEVKSDAVVPNKPYNIVNTVSGVHVYWDKVEGVEKYGLWRSETGKDGTYKWIANPTVPHFTDTTVVSGKTYYYRVTSMYGARHTEKSEALGITFVSTPDITSRANTASGVQLGWDKITGATGYAIYRKSYDGADAWVRVGTIYDNETFTWTDTSVKNANGTVYKYTIRALAGSKMKTLSGCRNAGRTMVRLSSQVLTSATRASDTSVKCTWTTSKMVTGYEIRFLVDGEVYKTFTIGNYKTGVKTFMGLEDGKTYTIQVRTYKKVDGVGSFYSDWSTAKQAAT